MTTVQQREMQEVQSKLQSTEEMGKEDDSPVTVADFGAQAIVAYTLQDSLASGTRLSLVAEEDAKSIRSGSIEPTQNDGTAWTVERSIGRCEDG